MADKKLLKNLAIFDPEIFALLEESHVNRQTMLSLMPTDNAISPFSTLLMGSSLASEFYDHHYKGHHGRLEKLAEKRFAELFNAEHAIVRVESHAAASRVVLQAICEKNDRILSFNLRKREHCTGDIMTYDFIKFALEPNTFEIDFEKLAKQANEVKPKLIIYSPTNYPKNIEYGKLAAIAKEAGATLWVDVGQNAGLVAAKVVPSPVPFADVVTFAANDALHGPQSGVILCKNHLAEKMDKTVLDTGHFNMKKNMLAAFAMVAKEAMTDEYRAYAKEVVTNAKALEEGLHNAGVETLCSPTENHLVLAKIPETQDATTLQQRFAECGLLVKAENLMTSDENVNFPILRLSSLNATTRALTPEEMEEVGWGIGAFINSPQDENSVKTLKKMIRRMVETLPIFAEDWLPALESVEQGKADMAINAMIHFRV